MQASIQSLQEDENAFAENPGDFYPDVINENLSSEEFLVREAYTELINGDYKNDNAEVVKDVYFTDGGKVMVDIKGLGPVDLKDLRSFDQPTEGLTMGYIEKLANIATTSVEDSAQAGALQTELLGDVLNNLNYYEKLELLNAQVTISPEFSKGNIKGTLTPKGDTRYEELFRKLVKNPDKHIAKGNWHAFFNPKVRKEKGMELNAGIEQPDVIQGVEDFIRDFTLDISNQFIAAGKTIQEQKRTQEINDALLKSGSGTDTSKEMKSGANTVINNAFAALEKNGFVGANGKYYKGYGTANQVEITPQEFEKIYMRELGGSLSSSNEDMYFQDYIAARDSFVNGSDMKEAMAQKLADDTAFMAGESDKHKAVVDLIADVINGEDNYGGGALVSGSARTYFGGGDRSKIFTKKTNEDGMTVYNINQEVIDIFEKLGYIDPLNFTKLEQNYATPEAFRNVVKKLAFNRYVPASEYENEASLFKVVFDANGVRKFSGVKGSPLSKSGLNQLNQSIQTINVFKSTQLRGLGSADGSTDLYEGKYDPTNVNKQ